MKEKKPSEVLRLAARWLTTRTGRKMAGCHAIAHVALGDWRWWSAAEATAAFAYYELLSPDVLQWFWFGVPNAGDPQDERLLALCFAAAIAESEGY